MLLLTSLLFGNAAVVAYVDSVCGVVRMCVVVIIFRCIFDVVVFDDVVVVAVGYGVVVYDIVTCCVGSSYFVIYVAIGVYCVVIVAIIVTILIDVVVVWGV